MSAVFRGSAEAEASRRALERRLAEGPPRAAPPRLSAARLGELCRELGADDVGFVDVDRAALGTQRETAERLLPGARTLISLVIATNRDNLVSPPRSIANTAFHHDGERLATVAHEIARALHRLGARAVVTSVGFPMEAGRWGSGAVWEISHKTVAVEAGLGHMGINRNVIHPRFGNFVLLDTLVVDAELDTYDDPLDYNPCADCTSDRRGYVATHQHRQRTSRAPAHVRRHPSRSRRHLDPVRRRRPRRQRPRVPAQRAERLARCPGSRGRPPRAGGHGERPALGVDGPARPRRRGQPDQPGRSHRER